MQFYLFVLMGHSSLNNQTYMYVMEKEMTPRKYWLPMKCLDLEVYVIIGDTREKLHGLVIHVIGPTVICAAMTHSVLLAC